jgi:hypothetical protein
MFQNNALSDVSDILAAVGGALDILKDILPFDQFTHILFIAEHAGQSAAANIIGLVFQAIDFHGQLKDPLRLFEVAKQRDHFLDHPGTLKENLR